MKVSPFVRVFIAVAVLFLLNIFIAAAQTPAGSIRGQVTDPSGAAITGATVILTPPTGSVLTAQTNGQGAYEFKLVPAGKYILTVVAQGFNTYENDNVALADQALRLNVPL